MEGLWNSDYFTFPHVSCRPCTLTNALAVTNATNKDEIAQFAEQGARDWETFLLQRTKELAPGGTMVIAAFCKDKDGQFQGGTKACKKPRVEVWTEIWRQLVAEGRITEVRSNGTSIILFYQNP